MNTAIDRPQSERTARPDSKGWPDLEEIAKLIRHSILAATTRAQSGHASSALSAVELMSGLFFGGTFRYNADHPEHPNNDRLIFSKGHASPLFYALWLAAGKVSAEEMLTYRQFGSALEGHPTPRFPFCEAATGSLGQGLSIGLGMALNAKYLDRLPYLTYVLLGDSEMAEGAQWEALAIAAHYKLDNLVGVLDVNRLGQRGPTMFGHDLQAYRDRAAAFGWNAICIDGHSFEEILKAYDQAAKGNGKPTLIIAKTFKGKGVSLLEDQDGWHGKALSEKQFEKADKEIGHFDKSIRRTLLSPENRKPHRPAPESVGEANYDRAKPVATREAYGNALARLYPKYPQIVSLDGEVSNSTKADSLRKDHKERFFEMFVAEQNMVGAALGLSRRGKIPFVSTFAAFFSRAFDQIRMAQYSDANIKFVGSHAGVSIGEDGPSQMGLEDLALFRTLLDGVVLHPCDAVSTEKLVEACARHVGISYIRTLRQKTPILYENEESFPIGGSKTLRKSDKDGAVVVAAGATVHEALEAYELLKKDGVFIRVIDSYSVKPIDAETLREAAKATGLVLTVEDHYAEGGLGEATMSALADLSTPVHSLAVRKKPMSGKPEELRRFEGISAEAIAANVEELKCV